MSGTNVFFKGKEASTQIYTSGSGNFIVPDGVYTIWAELYGGGGSGATTRSVEVSSGYIYSGEAGKQVTTQISVTPGQSLSYVVGSGGSAPSGGLFSVRGVKGNTTSLVGVQAAGGVGGGWNGGDYGVGAGRDGLRGSGGTGTGGAGQPIAYGGDGGYGNGGDATGGGGTNITGTNGGVGAGGASSWGSGGASIQGGDGGDGRIQIWWIED